MRWSRCVVPSLLLVGVSALTGCGTNHPTTSGPYDGGSSGPTDLHHLGEPIDVGGLRVRVEVKEVGGDEDGPWLVTTMHVENLGKKRLALPSLGLECDGSATTGYTVGDGTDVSPGRSVEVEVPLLISGTDDDYYAPIPPCRGTASIPVTVTSGGPGYTISEADGWRVDAGTLDELNALLPFTRPGGEPKDPDRPYAWADGESAPDGYQVVSVPDMTAAEALRILDPVRQAKSPDVFRSVVVDELDGGVVLFTSWLIPDDDVRALSRGKGGIAASYGNTVNGDDHVLVARDGRVVRSFDPFLDQDYLKTKPLPAEEGLDLKYDTGPASWALVERLTGIHITQEWLYGDHPAYLLR